LGWLEDINCLDQVEVITGDIRDRDLCKDLIKGKAPRSYVEANVIGTLNLCQIALENDCKRFIHTSTSEVYGNALYVPIDEKHSLQPQSPYSASKIAADSMALSFHYSFGLPPTVARPFNTYGPMQEELKQFQIIITMPNSDIKGLMIRQHLKKFAANRQKGRIMTENIIQTPIIIEEILKSVEKINNSALPKNCNIYGDSKASDKIISIIKNTFKANG